MKTLIFYIFIFLSLTEIIMAETSQEIEFLINVTECLERSNQLNNNITTNMKNILYNYNPYSIQKVYEVIQENLNLVSKCTNDLTDIPTSLRRYIYPLDKRLKIFNWSRYLKCIEHHVRKNQSLDGIIGYIREKNYYSASLEEIKLLKEGNVVILQCVNKKNEDINLGELFIGDEDIISN